MSSPKSWIVLFEVSGIQRYIFATNKRRENAGASELISSLKDLVAGAAERLGASPIVLSSGKAILTAGSRDTAVQLVESVTAAVLSSAPGVDIVGARVGPVDLDDQGALAEAIRSVHRRAARLRGERPGPDMRFARMPWVASCSTSGLPASGVQSFDVEQLERSSVSLAKLDAWGRATSRFADLMQVEPSDVKSWARRLDAPESGGREADVEGDTSSGGGPVGWVGVVHADGNGIGSVLREPDWLMAAGPSRYLDALASVSKALEEVTLAAFNAARSALPPGTPVLPLIVGGDDVTVVLDGLQALNFAVAFLRAFEDLTAQHETLGAVAAAAHGDGSINWLSASAGVAVVKPHFPFSSAYELAADLTENAKVMANQHSVHEQLDGAPRPTPISSIDFHQLLDSSSAGFEDVRTRLSVVEPDGTERSLVRRPYVVTNDARLRETLGLGELADSLGWELLAELAAVLGDSTSGALPRSQILPLRATLYRSRDQVQQDVARLWDRYPKSGLAALASGNQFEGFENWLLDGLDACELGVGR